LTVLAGKPPQKAGSSGKFVTWNGVRNDQDSVVGPAVIEELNGKLNEIVPVSGYQASLFPRGKLQLLAVRCPGHPGFMGAYGIYPFPANKNSYLRAEILV
jgi:hypothetical protein